MGYCRGQGDSAESFSGQKTTMHIVDWACKSQRHVTRSTFSAELLAAGDAVDQGILVSHLLYELEHGTMDAKQARDRRMEGGYIRSALYVDAKSVFAAVTATFIKQPAEKSLLCHAQYLRELLDKRILQHIFWIDTRDMAADGLMKGAVARDALHEFMEGHMQLRHEFEQWQCKHKEKPMQLSDSSNSSTAHTFFSISHLCAHEHPYLQPLLFSTPRASQAPMGLAAMAKPEFYKAHG